MLRISPAIRDPLIFSIILQTPLVILFSIMLDGGYMRLFTLAAFTGNWIGIALILLRRRTAPTRLDLFLIRWGFLICYALSLILADLISRYHLQLLH